MKALPGLLVDGARAAWLLRPRSDPRGVEARHFVALLAIYLIASLATGWIDALPPRFVDGAGLVALLADALLTLLAAWLLVTVMQRPAWIWGVASITMAATLAVVVIIDWPMGYLLQWLATRSPWAAIALESLRFVWWALVLFAICRALPATSGIRRFVAVILAFAISGAAWWVLPSQSLVTTDFAVFTADAQADAEPLSDAGDEIADEAAPVVDFDPERAIYDQPRLLDATLSKLLPTSPGRTNLYVVGFAGDGGENVFANEVDYVGELFSKRFGASGRTVALANDPATVTTRPLATLTNLRTALQAVAERMDPQRDILLLFLTSHGSEDHQLDVRLDPLALNTITPELLRDALQTTPRPRWRVIIVSACYSGGFIDALRDDSTMVMTASRADRTSFGCGADSDITWFGKALFAEALNETASLREAFDRASRSIADRERDAKIEQPSEPQIATSARIEGKLDEWQRSIQPGPAIPFASKRETVREALPEEDAVD